MSLKLMYITNRPEIASIADNNGVDRIFVDLETIGKRERQGGMDTVQSRHSLEDIKKVRNVIEHSELLVRSNPIHENSKNEINKIIENGADVIMLPYFKERDEVERFIDMVGGRARTMLLFETPESVDNIDSILNISGIDEAHIGLNDMHLGYRLKFMFEILINGTAEYLIGKFKEKNIPFGFGGIACLGKGAIPAEYIISEHYRLGSSFAILGRSFCDASKVTNIDEISDIFAAEMRKIREYEKQAAEFSKEKYAQNRAYIVKKVGEIVSEK